jgi:pimeloyl-ACP methyl ester carboxylesterase
MRVPMRIVDRGSGAPVVLVPGVQGRWEFFGPAVDALAKSFRVVTFSLCGELGSPRIDRARGIDSFADQIEAALDARGIDRAVICGVSFGGVAALRFAATRPHRTAGLILVSTPGPGFHLKKRHQLYARLPWIFAPVFLAEASRRLRREILRAIPTPWARVRFTLWQLGTCLRAPVMLGRMAERAGIIGTVDFAQEAARISSPTLLVSGDPGLDYVVPPTTTSAYAPLIGNVRAITFARTGHLGCVTRPEEFAAIVGEFVETMRRQNNAA